MHSTPVSFHILPPDQWCEGVSADEYVGFLKTLYEAVVKVDKESGQAKLREKDDLAVCAFGGFRRVHKSRAGSRGRRKSQHK